MIIQKKAQDIYGKSILTIKENIKTMKTCPHFSLGQCQYPEPCKIELILPNDNAVSNIIKLIEVIFATCPFKTIRAIRENEAAKKGVWN